MPPSVTDAFSASAADYLATMAPALRPVAEEVARRANLQPRDRVLDVATGTGIGARAALGDGRQIVALDGAQGMLDIARRHVPEATFVHADFTALPFGDGEFDAVLVVHGLHFAPDPVVALSEWRRVTRRGGRLSLSVPGPREATSAPIYEPVHRSMGITGGRQYPTAEVLCAWADAAGWSEIETATDPGVAIRLADDSDFDRWLATGSRGQLTAGWTPEQFRELRDAMLAVTPRDADRNLVIPFGALYLSARNA